MRRTACLALLVAALAAAAPPASASSEGSSLSLHVTVSTTPEASVTPHAGGSDLPATVQGVVDGAAFDPTGCELTTPDLTAFLAGGGSARVAGCAGTDLALDVSPGDGAGALVVTASHRGSSVRGGCRLVYDPLTGMCTLDCGFQFPVGRI